MAGVFLHLMVMHPNRGGALSASSLPSPAPWGGPVRPTAPGEQREAEDKETLPTYSGRNLHLKVPAGDGQGAKQQGEGPSYRI